MSVAVGTWQGAPRATLAGWGAYFSFLWRRNWVRALVWFIVIAGMAAFIGDYYKTLFTTPADLQKFANVAQAPAMASLVGVIAHPATLGGAAWCKGWMFLSLMLGIGMVYLVTRNLRGDEETGRLELMRAHPLGVHSPLLSATILTSGVAVVSGLGVALGMIAVGRGGVPPFDIAPGGAFAFGASIAAMGLLGVGIAALTNQLAPSGGAASGLGIVVFLVFYVVRMAGDLSSLTALLWASPIGWGELVDPWGDNRVLPLVLMVVLAGVMVVIGWRLEARRDMGDSVVSSGIGPSHASKFTQTVPGLGARTQRASMVVWLIAIMGFGALLGSVMNQFPSLLQGMSSGAGMSDNAMSDMIVSLVALAVGVFAVQSASALRSDEERGVLESQLAASVGRISWALQRLVVTFVAVVVLLFAGGAMIGAVWALSDGDASHFGWSLGALMVHLPAALILIGVAVMGLGWWPKQATAVSWTVVGVLWAVVIVGVALRLPDAVMKALPFIGGPHWPATGGDWAKAGIYLVVAAVLIVAGLIGFRRRDVPA